MSTASSAHYKKFDTAERCVQTWLGFPAGLILKAAKAAKSMKLSLDDFVQAAVEAMVVAQAILPSADNPADAETQTMPQSAATAP